MRGDPTLEVFAAEDVALRAARLDEAVAEEHEALTVAKL